MLKKTIIIFRLVIEEIYELIHDLIFITVDKLRRVPEDD